MRRNSRTQSSMPSEFVIKTVEGTSVEEYQLLRLHTKSNRREFRSVTGGVLHVSGGAQRDDVSFQPLKIGSRTWKIVLPNLQRGEYGFLPPGVASASLSASGKMYTFGIEDSPQKETAWTESGGVAEAMSSKPETSRLQNASSGTIGASFDGNPTTRHDGITLTNVVRDGPSAQAGIKPGDVILAIDDRYSYTAQEMNDEIHHGRPGDRIVVRCRHYTSVYEASLVLATAQ
jgi:PDZ domain